MGAGLIDDFIRSILSVPFCPYHFVHAILSNNILSVYHFVRTILSVTFCPLPFCPRTHQWTLFLIFCVASTWGFPSSPIHTPPPEHDPLPPPCGRHKWMAPRDERSPKTCVLHRRSLFS